MYDNLLFQVVHNCKIVNIFKELLRNRYYCNLVCSCGQHFVRSVQHIIHKDTKNLSCGCKHPMKNFGRNNQMWKGVGDIPKAHFDEIRSRAMRNNIEFNITLDDMWLIFLEQQGLCALTKLPLNFSTQRAKQKMGIEQTASLDRRDSGQGYILNNIQWIHKDANRMKNAFSQYRYIEICKLVAQNN